MKLKCVAIDDEPLALSIIAEYVSRVPELELVQTFDDAISGGELLRHSAIDLLFIDINMPDITGIELVKSLSQKPVIIFTTAHKKFAYDGFELEAVDYLLKPIDFERFKRAAGKAIDYVKMKPAGTNTERESLIVRAEYKTLKIDLHDIEYIESLEDYLKIYIANSRPVLTLMTMKAVVEKLPAERFKRIHRSYIVPVDKVKSILNRKLTLSNGTELTISDSYISFINEWRKANL